MSGISETEFRAYWYTLKATGVLESDEILKRLAHAGKSFHSTDQWADQQDFLDGKSFVELIQDAVDTNAAEIRRLRAENKELRASYERVEKYGQILLIETGGLKEANERLLTENAGLRPLAKIGLTAIVECAWQGSDFDGDVIQEEAEKFGAIVEAAEGYDPALHGESDFCDPGDRWYTFTPSVEAIRDALNEEMSV